MSVMEKLYIKISFSWDDGIKTETFGLWVPASIEDKPICCMNNTINN